MQPTSTAGERRRDLLHTCMPFAAVRTIRMCSSSTTCASLHAVQHSSFSVEYVSSYIDGRSIFIFLPTTSVVLVVLHSLSRPSARQQMASFSGNLHPPQGSWLPPHSTSSVSRALNKVIPHIRMIVKTTTPPRVAARCLRRPPIQVPPEQTKTGERRCRKKAVLAESLVPPDTCLWRRHGRG